jgi:hypothetical protein
MEGRQSRAATRRDHAVLVTVEQAVQLKDFHAGLLADEIRKRCALMADQAATLRASASELPAGTRGMIVSVLDLLDVHRQKFEDLALYLTTPHGVS